eukprot:3566181-Rhodomonas_salina.1
MRYSTSRYSSGVESAKLSVFIRHWAKSRNTPVPGYHVSQYAGTRVRGYTGTQIRRYVGTIVPGRHPYPVQEVPRGNPTPTSSRMNIDDEVPIPGWWWYHLSY